MNTFCSPLHIEIGQFQGSLELLVHMVQKKEFSLLTVEVSRIVEQLREGEAILTDIDLGGTVIDLLSLLICLKSRELLPFEDEDEEPFLDPQEALSFMAEYAQFKGPARYLIDCEELQSHSLPRGDVPILTEEKKATLGIEHLGIDELKSLFQKAARHLEVGTTDEGPVYTVAEALSWIEDELTHDDPLDLLSFFMSMPSKEALIVAFLAILELLKEGFAYLAKDEEQQMLDEEGLKEIKQIVEALLFAQGEPLPFKRIREILGDEDLSPKELREAIESLRREYLVEKRAFFLEETAGGYRLKSHPAFFRYVSRLRPKERLGRISMAASEVLAIVAYRQPVTRHDIELIRGVDSSGHLTTLQERSLIEVIGKKEVPGRPSLFATTEHFLDHFGLKSLADLPKL